MVTFVSYDGEYPNLCSGVLVLDVDGTRWEFPRYAMESGGTVWFDDEWREHVGHGPWSIAEWPHGFPDDQKEEALDVINENVPWGCCGGCV